MQGTTAPLVGLPERGTVLDDWLACRLSLDRPLAVVRRVRGTGAPELASPASAFADDLAALLRDAALREWEAADPAGAPVAALPAAPVVVLTPGVGLHEARPGAESSTVLRLRLGSPDSPWGPWSAVQAVARDRAEWLGAHVLLDRPGGPLLAWRGRPQVSAGDTAATLTVRALIEAWEALEGMLERVLAGTALEATHSASPPLAAAPAPADWERYARLGKGALSPLTWERALR